MTQQPAPPPPDQHADIDGQTSLDDYLCTRDENCKAEADQHEADCPVEKRLMETYGF